MTFKQIVRYGQSHKIRYVQRMYGNTLFDLVTYQPSLLDEEDILASDWIIPDQEKLSYLDQSIRFGTDDEQWERMNHGNR